MNAKVENCFESFASCFEDVTYIVRYSFSCDADYDKIRVHVIATYHAKKALLRKVRWPVCLS